MALIGERFNQGYIDVFIHEIRQDGQSKWENYKFNPGFEYKSTILLYDLWEIEKGKFYINLNDRNLIWELDKETTRPAKFNIK